MKLYWFWCPCLRNLWCIIMRYNIYIFFNARRYAYHVNYISNCSFKIREMCLYESNSSKWHISIFFRVSVFLSIYLSFYLCICFLSPLVFFFNFFLCVCLYACKHIYTYERTDFTQDRIDADICLSSSIYIIHIPIE